MDFFLSHSQQQSEVPNFSLSPTTSTSPSNTPGPSTTTPQGFHDRVFLSLSRHDQDTIRQHTVSNATDIDAVVQQALAATREKQAICQSKRWTFAFGTHTFMLREKTEKIVQWLNRFKGVGDVVSNADPIHVGLPWAGIRLLLEVSIAKR